MINNCFFTDVIIRVKCSNIPNIFSKFTINVITGYMKRVLVDDEVNVKTDMSESFLLQDVKEGQKIFREKGLSGVLLEWA
jgi:hypothetical protein